MRIGNTIPIYLNASTNAKDQNVQTEKIDKTEINGILSTTSKLFCPKNSDFNKLIQEITNKRNESSLKIFEKMLPEYLKE